MTYSDKLRDPRWQKKRLQVLNRDRFKCTMCKTATEELHVHHKEYKYGKEPWEYELDNFQTLCKPCHSVVEWMKMDDRLVTSCFGVGKFRIAFEGDSDFAYVFFVCGDEIDLRIVVTEKICKSIIASIKKHRRKK